MQEMSQIIEDEMMQDKPGAFEDRADAGRYLATILSSIEEVEDAVVCAIPAGGVPVGLEVARVLRTPIRITVVRKVQIPWNPEAGFGAVTWDGRVFLNRALLTGLGLSESEVKDAISKAKRNVEERSQKFADGLNLGPNLSDKIAIMVDDGLATGYTMFAAVEAARSESPRQIVVAVPTGSSHAITFMAKKADLVVCPNIRAGRAFAVAQAYKRWHDLTDQEVQELLIQAKDMGLTSITSD